MTNKQIARILKETAQLTELTGGNPFRGRAFSSAARTLERLPEPAVDRLAAGTLTDIPGIGQGLAAQIAETATRGSFGLRDDLLNAIPPGLLDVLRIKGLGAKKVRRLWQALGVTSLEALEEAALIGRVAALDGFGATSQEKILENLKLLRAYSRRRRYAEAYGQVLPVLDALRAAPGVGRAELCGAMRRRLETVEAAEVIVAADDADALRDALAPWHPTPPAAPLEAAPETALFLEGQLPDGLPLHVYRSDADAFGTAWWAHTGAEAFVAAFEAQYERPGRFADEAALFAHYGLPVIPPEQRETAGVLATAARGALPALITTADLRGSLHNHSTYSDGAHTLQQMADAARAMGLSYFGICDHSRSLTIAHGLSIERVAEQQAEVARLNAHYATDGGPRFRIFSGIESDILADGSLDYPDDVLATFDLVVASIHSGFNMTRTQATDRLIRAVENPYTTIVGHPTGRLLLAREGYPVDHEALITACAAAGVALELNANPYRLDLDWRWVEAARRQGVWIAINPDAHATEQLGYVRWGVAVARKGGLTAAGCLNALSLDDFEAWLAMRAAPQVS